MKNKLTHISAWILALFCLLSLAACRSGGTSSADGGSSSSAGSSSAVFSSGGELSSAASAAEGDMTLEDYINSDAMQNQINTLNESFEQQGGSLSVTADGNAMVFTFSFHDLGDADPTQLSDTLSSALDSAASSYEALAANLKAAIGADGASIKVIYAADDGTELCSREFKGEK